MIFILSLSLKDCYDNHLMVNLPKLFKRSVRCPDLSKIHTVSVHKHGADEWIVKYLMENGNCIYSLATKDQNEANDTMNELLQMINSVDLVKLTKNSKPVHFDFKLADQTDYLMKNEPVVFDYLNKNSLK